MRITILFTFNNEGPPAAESGLEDDITDVMLPAVGDFVEHTDSGKPFRGRVTERTFRYELPIGDDVHGNIYVTLCMDRTVLQ